MLQHSRMSTHTRSRRGGAVIILSLAMLMTLLFLGLFFFSFIDDESQSADIYAKQSRAKIDVNQKHVLNHALSQVIVSTNDSDPDQEYYARYSALAGGRYSLLASILGPIGEHDWDHNALTNYATQGALPDDPVANNEDLDGDGYFDPWTPGDFEAFNGGGMRIVDVSGTLYLDLNGDGGDSDGDSTPDRLLTDLILNGSELAGAAGPTRVDGDLDPTNPANSEVHLDAGYTYPDLNSLFLYHQSKHPVTGDVIVKPSFDVPGSLYAVGGFADATNDLAATRVLRPHTGQNYGGVERYLTLATTGSAGARPTGSGDTTRTIQPFATGSNPSYLADNPAIMGVWNGQPSPVAATNYDFHVDADNDGVNDAFLMDHDYPLVTFPDGRQAVPMFFWRIEDADALVNLNTAGDMPLYRLAERSSTPPTRAALIINLFNDPRFVTGTNYGASTSEINPGLPLRCDPSDPTYVTAASEPQATDQIASYLADQGGVGIADITADVDRLQLANIETAWLLSGRHTYDSTGAALPEDYDLSGRYGESAYIVNNGTANNPLPGAGTTGSDNQGRPFDDDRDGNAGRRSNGGAAYREFFPRRNGTPQVAGGLAYPPAVHPLDATGHALWTTMQAGVGMKRQFRDAVDALNNPSQWLYYNATNATPFGNVPMWQYPVNSAAGVLPWVTGGGSVGYLQAHNAASPVDALWDEPDELVLDDSDARFANLDDEPFPASEMTGLHASNADWSRLNITSRLRQLAPVNLEINSQAADIRRHFTTHSWDRPELGFALDLDRPWEFYAVQDDVSLSYSITHQYFPPALGRTSTLSFAPSATDPDNPDYLQAPAGTPAKYISTRDPYRPELRKLLSVDFAALSGNQMPQARLQLNGVLSDDSLGSGGGQLCFDASGNPRFRPLTPHPVFDATADAAVAPLNLTMVHNNGANVPYAFTAMGGGTATARAAQEWWARYDRQRLARDIYVLLWTVSVPQGLTTPPNSPWTTNPYTAANGYPDDDSDGIADVITEMAQFAVNAVDAMDHDSVLTKFEYDTNLMNGWDPTSADGAVAHGVEAQALTFSEALWINSKAITSPATFDHPTTLWDDSDGTDRHFLYMELRNVLPLNVSLANDTYRIVRADDTTKKITFYGSLSSPLTVGPGENFLIGSHSDQSGYTTTSGTMEPQSADFRLDYDANFAAAANLYYQPVVPYLPETDSPGDPGAGGTVMSARAEHPAPLCGLDLCHEEHRTTQQRFLEASSPVGYFLAGVPTGAGSELELILERRMNPQGDGVLDDAANDWVEIDRITVTEEEFQLAQTDDAATVHGKFKALVSRERKEPFFAHGNGEGGEDNNATNGFFTHSLGGMNIADPDADPANQDAAVAARQHQRNSVLPAGQKFEVWQPHFDRGYTSVYDLLSVLYISPTRVIYHDRTSGSVEGGLVESVALGANPKMTGIHAAGMRFEHPALTLPGHLSAHQAEHYQNRWYRLLEFLSVPSHTLDEVADQMKYRRRVPGRINLNTLRHEHNLAAIINDPFQIDLLESAGNGPTDDLVDTGNRIWYREMLRSRDGDNGGVIFPPGTPYSRPFRPLTYDDPLGAADPLRSTIMRRGMTSGGLTDFDQIGLFEARTPSDRTADQIDWHTRQRLLSRIANLTTNRSHVYVIWGGFQMHEAHETAAGQVQIGAQMTDISPYRELIVVDMSRMEEAYDAPTGAFNFGGFILHREVLP